MNNKRVIIISSDKEDEEAEEEEEEAEEKDEGKEEENEKKVRVELRISAQAGNCQKYPKKCPRKSITAELRAEEIPQKIGISTRKKGRQKKKRREATRLKDKNHHKHIWRPPLAINYYRPLILLLLCLSLLFHVATSSRTISVRLLSQQPQAQTEVASLKEAPTTQIQWPNLVKTNSTFANWTTKALQLRQQQQQQLLQRQRRGQRIQRQTGTWFSTLEQQQQQQQNVPYKTFYVTRVCEWKSNLFVPKSNDILFAQATQQQHHDSTADATNGDSEFLQDHAGGRTLLSTESKAIIVALPIALNQAFAGYEPACSIRLIVPPNMRILAQLSSRRLTFAEEQQEQELMVAPADRTNTNLVFDFGRPSANWNVQPQAQQQPSEQRRMSTLWLNVSQNQFIETDNKIIETEGNVLAFRFLLERFANKQVPDTRFQVVLTAFQTLSDNSDISSIQQPNLEQQFICDQQRLISANLACDGFKNCKDGHDEELATCLALRNRNNNNNNNHFASFPIEQTNTVNNKNQILSQANEEQKAGSGANTDKGAETTPIWTRIWHSSRDTNSWSDYLLQLSSQHFFLGFLLVLLLLSCCTCCSYLLYLLWRRLYERWRTMRTKRDNTSSRVKATMVTAPRVRNRRSRDPLDRKVGVAATGTGAAAAAEDEEEAQGLAVSAEQNNRDNALKQYIDQQRLSLTKKRPDSPQKSSSSQQQQQQPHRLQSILKKPSLRQTASEKQQQQQQQPPRPVQPPPAIPITTAVSQPQLQPLRGALSSNLQQKTSGAQNRSIIGQPAIDSIHNRPTPAQRRIQRPTRAVPTPPQQQPQPHSLGERPFILPTTQQQRSITSTTTTNSTTGSQQRTTTYHYSSGSIRFSEQYLQRLAADQQLDRQSESQQQQQQTPTGVVSGSGSAAPPRGPQTNYEQTKRDPSVSPQSSLI